MALPTGIFREPNLCVISSLTSSRVAVGSWNHAEYLNWFTNGLSGGSRRRQNSIKLLNSGVSELNSASRVL
jgi:hypothetical protein